MGFSKALLLIDGTGSRLDLLLLHAHEWVNPLYIRNCKIHPPIVVFHLTRNSLRGCVPQTAAIFAYTENSNL